ncbi:hypothetical protein BJ165DRAFT_1468698 [Panaeolus papilionaceus]|nr:hypothetical protein BJ165DRAFT_1468698 [Panaeolus papilionaceus]
MSVNVILSGAMLLVLLVAGVVWLFSRCPLARFSFDHYNEHIFSFLLYYFHCHANVVRCNDTPSFTTPLAFLNVDMLAFIINLVPLISIFI